MQNDVNEKNSLKKCEKESGAIISYFNAPITTIKPHRATSTSQVYEEVTTSKELKDATELLRNLKISRGEKDYRKYKAQFLPSITPSGEFSSRGKNGLLHHTGIICIDIDKLESTKNAEVLKVNLSKDEVIKPIFIFISPSGNGLKAFIRVDISAGSHIDYFNSLLYYCKSVWKIDIDESCKDVSRACFLSSDKDAFLRNEFDKVIPLGVDFINEWSFVQEIELGATKTIKVNNDHLTVSRLVEYAKILKNESICLTEDYSDWIKVGYGLCEIGEQGRSLFHLYSNSSSKYNKAECDAKYDELLGSYDNSVGVASLFYEISETGIDITYKDWAPVKTSNIRTAAQRMRDALLQPEIKPMLGAIWQKGELHILFGDTGCGKSILAVQIANAFTRGKSVFTVLPNECNSQKVLIYDFELSDRQFLKRYSDDEKGIYDFNENFVLSDIDFKELVKSNKGDKMDELIFKQIRNDIETVKPSVIIVDNLTFLSTQTAQETSAALDLMRELDTLKSKYNISILVLAHTPKVKKGTPLTLNELGGSKMISNFSDSVSCIGKSSKGKDIRYLKQVKPSRSAEIVFDSESVIEMELGKDECFLGFKFLDCTYESEHLEFKVPSETKDLMLEDVLQFHNNGASYRNIESTTGVPKSTIARWVAENNNKNLNEKENE
jgi:archaellum biogenesis ATPase FlaH